MYCFGLKSYSICLKIDVLYLSREVKCLLYIVLCKESPYNLINVLGLFSVMLQLSNSCKVYFIYISSASKTARKITKILHSFGS